MTKAEFRREAEKAGVNPNLYGLVINDTLPTRHGLQLSGGKVAGIVWVDEWKTEREYRPGLGAWESKFLSKTPYVVLKKDGGIFHVDPFYLIQYMQKVLDEQLIAMTRAQKRRG